MEGSISSNITGFSGGLLMSLISFAIVFLVCVGLMLLMYGLKHVAGALEKVTAVTEAAPSSPTPSASAVSRASSKVIVQDGGEEEIVAVITAAIVAACGAGARIVSITPRPGGTTGTPWRMTGRLQNFEGISD